MRRHEYPAGFPVRLALKDLKLVREVASNSGVELPLLDAVLERMGDVENKHANDDLAGVYELKLPSHAELIVPCSRCARRNRRDCPAESRMVVDWQLASHMRTTLVLDALRMALGTRGPGADVELVHHSDRGAHYVSFDYTQTLVDHRVLQSVGSVGDAYDNALAESYVDSFKTELIADRVWRTRSHLELAVVEYIAWFNHQRLHSALGDIPPAESEALSALRYGALAGE